MLAKRGEFLGSSLVLCSALNVSFSEENVDAHWRILLTTLGARSR